MQELTNTEKALIALLKQRGLDRINVGSVLLMVQEPEKVGDLLVWVADHPKAKIREIFSKAGRLAA